MAFRSLLFVPGNRPERFDKAVAAGADAVCIDLEDAVPPDAKAQARASAVAFATAEAGKVGIRINAWGSEHATLDARALRSVPLAFVMLPKAEHPGSIAQAISEIGHGAPPLWPVIETPEGLRQAWAIAAAPGVGGVLFGAADYAAEVGCTLDWDSLLYARGALAAAAGRAGVALLDVPYLDLQDSAGLAISTGRAKALGFTGRACIHPAQVQAVNAAFTPTPAELERAARIVAAFDAAGGAAAQLDGKLIELPVIRAARRTLERAGA